MPYLVGAGIDDFTVDVKLQRVTGLVRYAHTQGDLRAIRDQSTIAAETRWTSAKRHVFRYDLESMEGFSTPTFDGGWGGETPMERTRVVVGKLVSFIETGAAQVHFYPKNVLAPQKWNWIVMYLKWTLSIGAPMKVTHNRGLPLSALLFTVGHSRGAPVGDPGSRSWAEGQLGREEPGGRGSSGKTENSSFLSFPPTPGPGGQFSFSESWKVFPSSRDAMSRKEGKMFPFRSGAEVSLIRSRKGGVG